MFLITLVFGGVYLALYPGLGSFQGLLGWSSKDRYEKEVAQSEAAYAPLYAKYLATPLDELSQNTDALGTAKRIFSNNCAICHGADAGGYVGFPNLTDNAWLYGGDELAIKTTLNHGRSGIMPGWEAPLGDEGIAQLTEFVYSLSREPNDADLAAAGQEKYNTFCIACHGADGTGNQQLGTPDLTDDDWLYGGSLTAIEMTLRHGRNGVMPAFGEKLTESQIHLLTAYLQSFQK